MNRAALRNIVWGRRGHRADGTVGTKPPMYMRVARRRAAAKRARQARRVNR